MNASTKSYRINLFASIESIGKNKFIVWNEVSGLPIYVNPEADQPEIRHYDWASALTEAREMKNFYTSK